MEEITIQISMEIILAAGDARVACRESLDAMANFNFSMAKERLDYSQQMITKAHKIQTDAIQGETRGEKQEYSLLFAHAQDTLMSIYSEINIAKQLLKVFESFHQRLSELEAKG